uniref:Brain expressed associated with NEDD4 1 n=1 Tax=Lynx canadensis TaxID=61383 RepID=A0A667IEP9_LYNCA
PSPSPSRSQSGKPSWSRSWSRHCGAWSGARRLSRVSGGSFSTRSWNCTSGQAGSAILLQGLHVLKRPCPLARYNRTSYFYPTFSESSEHSHLLVSPVLVASAVIGVVIILSCITIIVGSIRRDRQARLQRHRHRHRRHHHHHHHHRRRRHREYEQGYVSDGTYSRSSHRIRYSCSPVEDWSPPLDLSSDGDVDVTVLRDLYPDSPPGYEECMGPGATQLYIPTDAPPPYSLTDSYPVLDGIIDVGGGRHQQAQRILGQGGLRTVSMDTLPPYEAVCGVNPPSGLLPLPGPEPGPRSPQGSPITTWALVSGPERIL